MYYQTNPYTEETAAGEDIPGTTGQNIQNYFNRIKKINNDLEPINESLANMTLDLTKLKAEETI
jgi:hypothetical protein